MQDKSCSMTSDELREHLKQLFNTDGSWNWNSVKAMEPSVWAAWLEYRLKGKDPFVRYSPDEYPDNAHIPFLELARMEFEEKAEGPGIGGNRKIVLDNFRIGAAQFLATLDPIEEEAHIIRNTIYVVGNLKARSDDSLKTLREWINKKVFLEKRENHDLHNETLLGLASLQKRKNTEDKEKDEEIWKDWIKPPEDAPDFYNTFVPAAFCGLVFSHEDILEDAVEDLFKAIDKEESAGRELEISGAILSLFVNDDRTDPRRDKDVRENLFKIVKNMPRSKSKWNVFKRVGEMWGHSFPDYDLMEPSMLIPSTRPSSPSTHIESPSISRNLFGCNDLMPDTWRQ